VKLFDPKPLREHLEQVLWARLEELIEKKVTTA